MKSYREKLHPASCFPANPPAFNTRNHLFIRIAPNRTRFKNVRVTFIGVNITTYSSIAAILVSQIAESIECINIFDICSKEDVKTNLNDLQLISLFKKGNIQLNYVQSYWETRDSSIVIINVQHHRLEDESLSKWTQTNAQLVEDIVRQVCIHSPRAILIVCTQPNELMTYVASRISRFPRERIFGLGASIDTAYAHKTIAENLNGSINGYFIIGEANASISTKNLTIQGIPYSEIYTKSSFRTTEKAMSNVKSKRQTTEQEWNVITMLKNKQTIYSNPSRSIHRKTMINYLVQKTPPSCPTTEQQQQSPTINLSFSTKPRSNWTEALLITRILQALINDSDFQSNFTVDISSIVPNSKPTFLHYPTIIGATNGAIKYLVPLSTLKKSSLISYEKLQSKLDFCSSNQTIS